MTTIGVVSPGAMGSALGRSWQARGAVAVATVAGRSERTRTLAEGLTLLDDLDAVVAASDVVVSVCPPAAAVDALAAILAAARRTTSTPSRRPPSRSSPTWPARPGSSSSTGPSAARRPHPAGPPCST
jgi:hypothetical protein